MLTSRRPRRASAARGTSRGRFATGPAHSNSGHRRICRGRTLSRRSSRWRHRTNYARRSGRTIRGTARHEQHSRPTVLGPGLSLLETRELSHLDAVDSDHRRKEAHGALGEERPTIPFQHGTFDPDVLGRSPTNLTRPPCQRARGASASSYKCGATPSRSMGDVTWHRTRRMTPNSWPAIPSTLQTTAGCVHRICPSSWPQIAF